MNSEQETLVKRLKEAGLSTRCFLKVGKDKAAFEVEWQNRLYTPEELEACGCERWGICGKSGLVPTDTDNMEMATIIRQILPLTLETLTPRRQLPHFYFAVLDGEVPNKVLKLKGVKEGSGEIRSQNEYLVSPGTEITYEDLTTHEDKTGRYTILHDRPIAKVKYADFMAAIGPYLGSEPSQKITHEQMRKGVPKGTRHAQGIKYVDFLIGTKKFDATTALYELTEWNKLNQPPMDTADLERMVQNAVGFTTGKNRNPLADYGFEIHKLKNQLYILTKIGEADPLSTFPNLTSTRVKKAVADVTKAPMEVVEKTFGVLAKKLTVKTDVTTKTEEEKEKQGSARAQIFDAETEAEINSEIEKILQAENQLDALKPHLDNMAVGEDNTKQALAVLLRSAKERNPKNKQIITLKATEGAGKTSLINKMVQGYKVKEVGRFSAHALDYTDLASYEILYLKELGSMDEEKQGVSTVKFLSSDDRGYTVEITVKDEETGKFTTEQHKIPPITVVSSTTRLILDAQFERRNWPLPLDETVEQTARVAKWKAQLEMEENDKILGFRKTTSYEFSSEVYKRFIEKVESKTVLIPFPKRLLDVLGTEALRVRGDIDKLLTFAKLYGAMNLKRIQQIKDGIYILSPEVAVEALKIALEPLTAMLTRIDKRTTLVFNALKNIVNIKQVIHTDLEQQKTVTEVEVRYDKKNTVIDKALRERVAVKLGKSEKTIRTFFSQLENSGYVSGDGKKPKSFTLLYDVEDIEQKLSGILAKTKSADVLISELVKEAQEWCQTRLEIFSLTDRCSKSGTENVKFDGETAKELLHPSVEKKISNPSLPPSQVALAESSSEHRQISELPILANVSNEKLCAICQKPIPADSHDYTFLNGLAVHCQCLIKLKSKEGEPEL